MIIKTPLGRTLLSGDADSGKTYKAIKGYLGKYAYLAPCQQLVYEVFQDYGNRSTTLQTGEVHIPGNNGNFMGTYESFKADKVKRFDRIIIDEAHFLTDYERGGHLLDILEKANKCSVPVLLLTATKNMSDDLLKTLEINEEKLEQIKNVPKMIEVDYNVFLENAKKGLQSIYFCKYTPGDYLLNERSKTLGIPKEKIGN